MRTCQELREIGRSGGSEEGSQGMRAGRQDCGKEVGQRTRS